MQRPALRLGGYQPPATVEPATTRPVAGPNGTTPSADSRAPLGTGRRSTPGRWPRGRRRTQTRTRSIRSTRMTPTQTGRCTAGRRGSRTGWAASRSTPARAARDTHSTDSSTVRHPHPTPSCGRTAEITRLRPSDVDSKNDETRNSRAFHCSASFACWMSQCAKKCTLFSSPSSMNRAILLSGIDILPWSSTMNAQVAVDLSGIIA